jgi:hypothetical protein
LHPDVAFARIRAHRFRKDTKTDLELRHLAVLSAYCGRGVFEKKRRCPSAGRGCAPTRTPTGYKSFVGGGTFRRPAGFPRPPIRVKVARSHHQRRQT